MNIRVKFKKYGVMKFVGHLDLMRYFQKSIRRAGIDIAYSGGFSPHQVMSFAAPLSLGATSDGEYFDMEVNTTLRSSEAVLRLNETMAEGIEVVSYRRLSDSDKNAMSIVAAADYRLGIRDGQEAWDAKEALNRFYRQPKEILVTKKTKKGEKTIDIKPLIYAFQADSTEGRPSYYLKVCTGSSDNLKPELALMAFYEFLGEKLAPSSILLHRLDIYGKTKDALVPLGEMGEDIE